MECSNCQHENPNEALFCNSCGTELDIACPSCAKANPAGSRFCNSCGAALVEPSAEAPESQPARARPSPASVAAAAESSASFFGDVDPRAYTPQHLADRILTQKSGLEGERKHVTILFADLENSSALAREIGDPEEMHRLLDRAFRAMLGQVHGYEGTINQFTGDGVMALFGAPLALEDAPRRAVVAGLGIQRVLASLDAEVQERFGRRFLMRIGIHTGPVVVGRIGDDLRMDYTAVGDTTNLASRLQSLAEPGTVVISEATQRQVEGFFDVEPLSPADVKGQIEPVQAYQVLAASAASDRIEVHSASDEGLTRYVERERELDLLDAAFSQARAGRGQVAFIVGEAGLGKSRLLHEFRRRLTDRGEQHEWVEGRCASYGQTTPFHAIADSVRRSNAIDDRDDEASALAKLLAPENATDAGLEWTLPFVRALLSLPTLDSDADALEPMARRAEMCRAVHTRLLRAAERVPQILVIEDLHWVDAASEEFLAFLTDTIGAAPVLVLLTHRPGYEQPFGDRSYYVRVPLQPLSEEAMFSMVSTVLAADDLPPQLREMIAAKAEGNPLFVEEVTTSLLEEGVLALKQGHVSLTRELSDVSIPDRIQDVLMARLDRLQDEPKRAIQIASIIGREFALRLLQRIHEAAGHLDEIVGELRSLELIYEKTAHPELAYMFKHALTHEVAYESVLVARRKTLHRVVGVAIEELYTDRLPEHYEALAYHFSASEEWRKALQYHELASEKSAEAYANHAAIEHCERAIEIAGRLGDVPDERKQALHARIGACCWMTSAFQESGDGYAMAAEISQDPAKSSELWASASLSYLWNHSYDMAESTAERAIGRAPAEVAPAGHAYAILTQDQNALIRSDDLEDDSRIQEAIRLAERSGDPQAEVMAFGQLVQRAEWRGDYRRAIECADHAIELAARNGTPGTALFSSWFLSIASVCIGDYARGMQVLSDGIALCDHIGDRAIKARLLNTLGWAYAEVGAHETAAKFNRHGTEMAREAVELGLVAGAPELYANAVINLSGNMIQLGRTDEAAEQLAAIQHQYETDPDPWMRWRWSAHLQHHQTRLALARGNADQALALSAIDVDASYASKSQKLICRALELQGRIHLVREEHEEATRALTTSSAVATALEHPSVAWRAESLLAEVARRRGDTGAADEKLASVSAVFDNLSHRIADPKVRREFLGLGERIVADPVGAQR